MSARNTHPSWRLLLAHGAWMAAFLCLRTHYFLTIIVARVFGWR